MVLGEEFKIGLQVHALLFDGRCGVGWITAWDADRGRASVMGFSKPTGEPSLGELIFSGEDVAHDDAASAPPPADGGGGPRVVSFHLPGACRWHR
jgi:hypothetical protein